MNIRKKYLNENRIILIILCSLTILFNYFAVKSEVSSANSGIPIFSMTIKDKPLREVLDKISKSVDYKITIGERWANLPMTAKLVDVNVEEGLRRLLKHFNHSLLIVEADRTIYINIHGPFLDNRPSISLPVLEKSKRPLQKQRFVGRNLEVIPPERTGQKGVTQRTIEAKGIPQRQIDPGDLEVIPPEHPGGVGVTLRKLEELRAPPRKIDHRGLRLIPPVNLEQSGGAKKE
jgi:hypothetical protein